MPHNARRNPVEWRHCALESTVSRATTAGELHVADCNKKGLLLRQVLISFLSLFSSTFFSIEPHMNQRSRPAYDKVN